MTTTSCRRRRRDLRPTQNGDAQNADAQNADVQNADVAAARRAAHDLAAAVDRLGRSHPDTVDLRRLTEDVGRVHTDLDLFAGAEPGAGPAGKPAAPDVNYDPRHFGDGADVGVGRRPR